MRLYPRVTVGGPIVVHHKQPAMIKTKDAYGDVADHHPRSPFTVGQIAQCILILRQCFLPIRDHALPRKKVSYLPKERIKKKKIHGLGRSYSVRTKSESTWDSPIFKTLSETRI